MTPVRPERRPIPRALKRLERRHRCYGALSLVVLIPLVFVLFEDRPSEGPTLALFMAFASTFSALASPRRRRLTWLLARRGPKADATLAGLQRAYQRALAEARSTRTMSLIFLGSVVLHTLSAKTTAPWHGVALLVAPILSACAAGEAVVEVRRLQLGAPGRPRPPRLDRVFA